MSTSASLLGRAVLIGSVLSFTMACAQRDAAKGDSATAASDTSMSASAAPASAATTPSSAVESTSTGETAISSDSNSKSAAAAPAPAAAATPTHHATHHSDSGAKATPATAGAKPAAPAKSSMASTPAAPATPATLASASSDTGQKTAADTGKKTAAAAGGSGDHLLVSPQEYEGWKMFSVYCYRCHGVDAMDGGIAPNLHHSVSSEGSVTHDVFITTVTNGRVEKGMPSWKALLSPEQMEDLWHYVTARSSGRLAPGRPHMDKGANP